MYKNFDSKDNMRDCEKIEVGGSSQKKEAIQKIKEVLKYISNEVGCEFPSNFAAKLYQLSIGRDTFSLGKNHAAGIIEDWRIWEPYVDSNDATRYISHKLEVLCQIHCGVTYGYSRGEATDKSFIGKYATVKKEIPAYMYTIIHSSGLVSLNGKIRPVDQNDPRAVFTHIRKPKAVQRW